MSTLSSTFALNLVWSGSGDICAAAAHRYVFAVERVRNIACQRHRHFA